MGMLKAQEQFSQEIEIIGGSGTSFEWVLGGFYFEDHIRGSIVGFFVIARFLWKFFCYTAGGA